MLSLRRPLRSETSLQPLTSEVYADPPTSDKGLCGLVRQPKAESSEVVYGRLMDDGLKQGMTLFEIDCKLKYTSILALDWSKHASDLPLYMGRI